MAVPGTWRIASGRISIAIDANRPPVASARPTNVAFEVWSPDGRKVNVDFTLQTDAGRELARFGRGEERWASEVSNALIRFCLRRVVAIVRGGRVGDQSEVLLDFESASVGEVLKLAAEKECEFQDRYWKTEGRGITCTVASPTREDRPGVRVRTPRAERADRRTVATTLSWCRSCELPNTDALCSHFVHVAISGHGPDTPPAVETALCDLDRDEITTDPTKCYVGDGGHECASTLVHVELESPDSVDPNRLPAVFDHLNLAWKERFGRRLIEPATLDAVASLAEGCTSQSDLQTKLADLASVLKSIKVPDSEIPPDALTELRSTEGRNQPLNRLEESLRAVLAGADIELACEAIQELRHVNGVRNATAHPEAASRYTTSLQSLGLPLDLSDSRQVWRIVRQRTALALDRLRVASTS